MNNATFLADALEGFNATPARGPYTLAMSNIAIFVPLPNVTVNYMDIVNKIRSSVADGSAASYLPLDYKKDPAMIAGYKHQLSIQADFLSNPRYPSIESGFATGSTVRAINLHALSRGTVRLNLSDPLQLPLVDYRIGTNPIDFDVYLAHLKYLRKMVSTPSMRKYGAVEIGPGAAVTSDEALIAYIKDQMTLTFYHPCCTAAMIPRDKGGVVGPDLKVHGAAGLRIVDMSVLPLLPSSHLSALAYAVGEKVRQTILQSPVRFEHELISLGCGHHHKAMV